MPKNVTGGKNSKKLKNNANKDIVKKRDLEIPETEDDSHVAIIQKTLGDGRYICKIINSGGLQPEEYLSHLSYTRKKKFAKGTRIEPGTYLLIAIRDLEKTKPKADIIFIYNETEIEELVKKNYINKLVVENGKKVEDFIDFSESALLNNNDDSKMTESELINI